MLNYLSHYIRICFISCKIYAAVETELVIARPFVRKVLIRVPKGSVTTGLLCDGVAMIYHEVLHIRDDVKSIDREENDLCCGVFMFSKWI